MDESHSLQNRKSRRSPVLLTATLESGGRSYPVRLRNFSAEGALVDADVIPEPDSFVLFRRKSTLIGGHVAWVNGRLGGVKFERSLDREELLRHIPEPKSTRVAVDAHKRPSLVNHKLTKSELEWIKHWVDASPINRPGE